MGKDSAALVIHRPAGELAEAERLEQVARALRLTTAAGAPSENTIRNYLGGIRRYFAWCAEVAHIDPAKAGEDDLISYRAYLVQKKRRPATIGLELMAVKRLYAVAGWRDPQRGDPAAGVKAPVDRTSPDERRKVLSPPGLQRLLDAPQGDRPQQVRDRAILACMGILGMRVSEVAGLRLADVDLAAGTHGELSVTGKGAKTRMLALTPETARRLRAWLEQRPPVARPDTATLFVTLRNAGPGRLAGPGDGDPGPGRSGEEAPGAGRPMTARGIRELTDNYLRQEGLKRPGLSCHSLRHTCGTLAKMNGAEDGAIARMFGHSNLETTRLYTRAAERYLKNPALFVEEAVWPSDMP